MAEYGVGTQNIFDVLGDEGTAPAPAKKAKDTSKDKKPAAKPAAPAHGVKDKANKRGGRGGAAGAGSSGRSDSRPAKHDGMDRRGNHVPRKGQAKGGHGHYNWGSNEDEARPNRRRNEATEEPAAEAEATPEATSDNKEEAPATNGDAAAAPETPAEPEDTNITYDQYLKRMEEKKVEEDAQIQRRAVQIDEKKWRAVKVLNNPTQQESAEEEEEEKKSKKKKTNKINAADLSRDAPRPPRREGGEFRGGRGGGRGRGRGRGGARGGGRGGRGGNGGDFQFNENAFPALGK